MVEVLYLHYKNIHQKRSMLHWFGLGNHVPQYEGGPGRAYAVGIDFKFER